MGNHAAVFYLVNFQMDLKTSFTKAIFIIMQASLPSLVSVLVVVHKLPLFLDVPSDHGNGKVKIIAIAPIILHSL